MLKLKKVEVKTQYEEEVERILTEMSKVNPSTDEYKVMSEALERVMKYKPEKEVWKISPDAIAAIAGNLAGIGLILGFEKFGVVTSKALGFVLKNRI